MKEDNKINYPTRMSKQNISLEKYSSFIDNKNKNIIFVQAYKNILCLIDLTAAAVNLNIQLYYTWQRL